MAGGREGLICAILAGGRSLRMGRPKGMIAVGGRPLIARIAAQARRLTDRIFICGNAGPDAAAIGLPAIPDVYEGRGPLAGLHAALLHDPSSSVLLLACDLPNVHSAMLERLVALADGYEGRGPLAGLHAALLHDPSSSVLLLACDLPNVHSAMLERLVALADGYDIAAACTSDGIPQPLCAFYRRTCIDAVENCLKKGVNRAMALLSDRSLRVRLVGPEAGNFTDSDLLNLNTPEDLKKLSERSSDTHI